jgi:hypothetical protein
LQRDDSLPARSDKIIGRKDFPFRFYGPGVPLRPAPG